MNKLRVWSGVVALCAVVACGQIEGGGNEAPLAAPPPPPVTTPPIPAKPGIIVSAASASMTTEAGGTAAFAVVLASQPSARVSIAVASSDETEARSDKASVVFTAGDWNVPQLVTVAGVDDEVDDGDKDVTITLARAISADAAYAALDPDDVKLRNMDDDAPGIATSPLVPSTKTTEKGGQVIFTVQLRLRPTASVTVPIASSNMKEGIVDSSSLTFTPTNWNVPQAVTVTGIDDKVADPAAAYRIDAGKSASLDPAYAALSAKVELTNTDDDEVVQFETGQIQACARFVDGRLKCWGDPRPFESGALGYGDNIARGDGPGEMGDALPYVDLGTGRTAKFVATSSYHTCAILDDDTVKCWGSNTAGKLGYGDVLNRGLYPGEMGDALPVVDFAGHKVKTLAAAGSHTCAILDDDTLRCWGSGLYGELGYGDANGHGYAPNQMGANLPAVDLGTNRKAKQVSAGGIHTCAILDDDSLKCWGDGSLGKLGQGDTANRGRAPGQMGDALAAIDLGTNRKARSVACGDVHTCAVLDNGTVKCWGAGGLGSLGQGNTDTMGDGPGEMGNALRAVSFGFGRTVKQIKAGYAHTCAILDDDSLRCWGYNSSGALGLGGQSWGDKPGQMGDELPAVNLGTGIKAKALGGGRQSSSVLTTNYQLKAWGYGAYGVLGQGSTNNIGASEMGDALPPILVVGP